MGVPSRTGLKREGDHYHHAPSTPSCLRLCRTRSNAELSPAVLRRGRKSGAPSEYASQKRWQGGRGHRAALRHSSDAGGDLGAGARGVLPAAPTTASATGCGGAPNTNLPWRALPQTRLPCVKVGASLIAWLRWKQLPLPESAREVRRRAPGPALVRPPLLRHRSRA